MSDRTETEKEEKEEDIYDTSKLKSFSRDVAVDTSKESWRPDVIGFGIFYKDWSTFFGRTEEDWKKAPKENVELILLYLEELDEIGNPLQESVCGWDYYGFDGNTFTAADDTRALSSEEIVYGRWMDTEEWVKLVHWALIEFRTQFRPIKDEKEEAKEERESNIRRIH